MAGFLYFISGGHAVNAELLARVGLAEVFSGESPAFRGCSNGPAGLGGVICAAPESALAPGGKLPAIGFFPERQSWRPAPGEKFWLGAEAANPPTPADLARPQQIGGYRLTLEDGTSWLVPIARSFPRGTILPKRMILGEHGELVWEPLPRFAAFCADAERIWDDFRRAFGLLAEGEQVEPLSVDDARDLAVRALAVNYRVGLAELAWLGCLTTLNQVKILDAVIDLPAIIEADAAFAEAIKKNAAAAAAQPSPPHPSASDTGNSCDGSGAGSPATAQASQT